LPGSPRIYSKAVIIDFEDDAFQDMSLSVSEVTKMIRWGKTRAEPSAALRRAQEAREGL
jgi:hypothetical protein